MQAIVKIMLVVLLIFNAVTALAAKPVSIKHIEDVVTNSEAIYQLYQVRCSNGKVLEISAWNGRKLWCLGSGAKNDCFKKQIKAAKKTCRTA